MPKTRPVVAGNIGYACGLSEQISEIVEPAWHSYNNKVGVISTDDMLGRIKVLKQWMIENKVGLKKRGQVLGRYLYAGYRC